MEDDFYKIISWPDIQFYIDIEGFDKNAYLINDEQGLDVFGSSAYFVNCDWIKSITYEQ